MSNDIKKRNGRPFKLDSSVMIIAVATDGEENGIELDKAADTMNQGIVYRKAGRFHEAENAYQDALKIYRTIPDTELDQARCTMNLGNVYLETDRFQEAENTFRYALKIFCSLPDTELEQVACLANMSSCHKEKGQIPQARFCAQMSLALCKSLPPEATMEFSSVCHRVLESIAET